MTTAIFNRRLSGWEIGSFLGLFLFFVLNVIDAPKLMGYQYGSIILLVTSIGFLWRKKLELFSRWDWALLCSWLLYASLQIIGGFLGGLLKDGLMDAYPFLLSIPILLMLRQQSISVDWVYRLNVLGSFVLMLGCIAFRWSANEGVDSRTLNTLGMMSIQFACLVMAMFSINLAGVFHAWAQQQWLKGCLALLAAIVTGLLVLYSTARGSWPSLILLPILSVVCFGHLVSKKIWLVLVGVLIGSAVLLVTIPQSRNMLLQEGRINEAVADMNELEAGNTNTSIGLRFVMWKNAAQMITQKPIQGWGQKGFIEHKTMLGQDDAKIAEIASFGHPHNEILNAWVKKGLLGLISLLLLYFVPWIFFVKECLAKKNSIEQKVWAFAGVAVVSSFMVAGLTQTIFAHNSGRLYYAMIVVIIWALLQSLMNHKHQQDIKPIGNL